LPSPFALLLDFFGGIFPLGRRVAAPNARPKAKVFIFYFERLFFLRIANGSRLY
jgi:hypothetical protein